MDDTYGTVSAHMKELCDDEDSCEETRDATLAYSTVHLSNTKDENSQAEDVFLQYSLSTEVVTTPLLAKTMMSEEDNSNVTAQDDEYKGNTLSQHPSTSNTSTQCHKYEDITIHGDIVTDTPHGPLTALNELDPGMNVQQKRCSSVSMTITSATTLDVLTTQDDPQFNGSENTSHSQLTTQVLPSPSPTMNSIFAPQCQLSPVESQTNCACQIKDFQDFANSFHHHQHLSRPHQTPATSTFDSTTVTTGYEETSSRN